MCSLYIKRESQSLETAPRAFLNWSLSGRLTATNSSNLVCSSLYNLTSLFLPSKSGIYFSILWNWVWSWTCFGQMKHQMWQSRDLKCVRTLGPALSCCTEISSRLYISVNDNSILTAVQAKILMPHEDRLNWHPAPTTRHVREATLDHPTLLEPPSNYSNLPARPHKNDPTNPSPNSWLTELWANKKAVLSH